MHGRTLFTVTAARLLCAPVLWAEGSARGTKDGLYKLDTRAPFAVGSVPLVKLRDKARDKETTHLLASATKLASATTMMTLVHDKLIQLDDPIKKYLPQFGKVRGAITIRQLLAQTHGMPANHKAIPLPQQDNGNLLQVHLAGRVFKGRRLLSEATVAEVQKDQSQGVPFIPGLGGRMQYGYGLAW